MPATQITRSLPAPSQSTADAIATLISNVTGGTVSAADVADQMRQLEKELDPEIGYGRRFLASSLEFRCD